MEENRYIEYKKAVNRFFKECGLYNEWKSYIKHKRMEKTWFIKNSIDRIIGNTTFTSYVEKRHNIYFGFYFSTLFKTYLKKIGKNEPFFTQHVYSENDTESRGFSIDANSCKIEIKALKK